jgi:phage/plasmid-like protein (TIGR03299 family)
MIFNKYRFKDSVKTAEEASKISGINWTAIESPLTIKTNQKTSTIAKAIIRSDNQFELGVVGVGYVPVQILEGWTFMDAICDKFGASYRYAIEIHSGRKVLIYAELPDPLEIREGDTIMKGFLLSNGFDGSNALHVEYILHRVLDKTMMRARLVDNDNSFALKHTKNVKMRVEEAFKMFSLGESFFAEFEKSAKVMISKEIDPVTLETFLAKLYNDSESTKSDNKREEIATIFGAKKNHTAWDLYTSVNEYIDFHSTKDEEKRNVYSTIGSGANLKEKAFDLLLKI